MRKLILSVLLATSVAMPAMAQDRDGRQRERGARNASSEQRQEARAARRADRAERAQRPERAERAERPERAARERAQAVQEQSGEQQMVRQRDVQQQRGERRNYGERRSNNDGMIAAIERQQAAARIQERRQSVAQQRDYRRDARSRDGSMLGRALEQSRARNGQVVIDRDNDNRDRRRYSQSNRQWNNHWRSDRRHDWRNYRQHNRSLFRLGNYYDPYGSRYRRFSIGFSLFPSYYQSNNWLNDPWQYRLPPAYGPYRWVRYYDDALLVNVYNGQVVDVVHSFFW